MIPPSWRRPLLIIPVVLAITLLLSSRLFSLAPSFILPYLPGGDGRHPVYKTVKQQPYDPVVENYPVAASALSPADVPHPPAWISPPAEHVAETTPLLIGFTHNWPLLQQAVVAYIAAGWPPGDIYVVDNSGAQFSNVKGRLTLQNPAYIDYIRLTRVFGVNVLTTPTLLTFAQLQNFFLFTAQQQNWPNYFWSHMDVVVQSDESQSHFKSLYQRAVESLRDANSCAASKISTRCLHFKDAGKPWAIRFFAYDLLALVNTAAYLQVGGWDTAIPFYKTDCDMHFRLASSGFSLGDDFIGYVYDIGTTLPDVRLLLRENTTATLATCLDETRPIRHEYAIGDCRYRALLTTLTDMQEEKLAHEGGRNYWQSRQNGGQGEPFWHHPRNARRAFQEMDALGQRLFGEKWGHRDCDLKRQGLQTSDAWRVEKDW